MTDSKKENNKRVKPTDKKRIRKAMEGTATFALLLVAIGLVGPFASVDSQVLMVMFKWIFTVGAALYLIARVVNVNEPGDSFRVRRLRRLESWAGVAFCIAAFFWWWNAARYGSVLTLRVLQETVMFTLVGAMIQIISSWLLVSAIRKQREGADNKK